jgi:hypothetical protein
MASTGTSQMMNLALAGPFIDVDRMNRPAPSGGKLGARAWIAGAWVVLCVVWLVARLNGYWVR